MASNQWCTLWGPVAILDYEDDLRFKGITNERLGDLQGTVGITSLELKSSKEMIDLSLLAHLQDLKCLSIDKCKFENLKALAMLPALEVLIIDNCNFDLQDIGALKNIKRLNLSLKGQQKLPDGLVFPLLESLNISGEKIDSIEFIRHSKLLYNLGIRHTGVSDISPVIDCKILKYFSFSDNHDTDIRPLASLKYLERVSVWPEDVIHKAVEEWGFVRPLEKNENTVNELKNAIKAKIKQKDWKYVLQLPWSKNFEEALSACYRELDFDSMKVLLNHPDDQIFKEIFICGIRTCDRATPYKIFQQLIKGQSHRLLEPLLASTERFPGGMHLLAMDSLEHVSSPEYSEIYHRLLARRSRFCGNTYGDIVRSLKTIAKTKDHTLVAPIIDLLNFESKIIGGDNVFMKRIFKAVGSLGNTSDIPLIEQNYSVASETREDVKKEYQAMMTKLAKKKA